MRAAKEPLRVPVVILASYYPSWTAEEKAAADRTIQGMIDGLRGLGHRVELAQFCKHIGPAIRRFRPTEWVVLNWCEGVEDEVDGEARVCAELEAMGYTYTGNPPTALALSVAKGRVKELLQRAGIPTPPGREFAAGSQVTGQSWPAGGFPAIVKAANLHYSLGICRDSVVQDHDQLRRRVAYMVETYRQPALVEAYVAGREINVSIWDDEHARVLPLREVDFSAIADPLHRIVTWDSKWVPDSAECVATPVITRPHVSGALARHIERVALGAYDALGCRDYARIDLRIDAHEQPWVVDVNPNPDISPSGGFVGSCVAAGYSYAETISRILAMATARRGRRDERDDRGRPAPAPAP